MKIKQCSLFSGIGAFEEGFKNIGLDFELTSFCEIDKHSSCAYAAIHGVSEDLNLGDISQVKSEDIPEFNLLTWGFPCQDISVAGNEAGIKVGTRSGLYFEGYRILKDRLPKYSIIENVKNLTQKGHIDEFNMILSDLESLGYTNYWKVLNAKDFGVPQNRERVFIVSILGDQEFEFPKGFDSGIRLKDVLEEDIDEKYYVSEKMLKGFLAHNKNHEGRTGFIWKPTNINSNAKCIRANGGLCPTDNTIVCDDSHTVKKEGFINQDTQSAIVMGETGLSQSLCAGTHGYCNGYIKNEPMRVGGLFDTEKSKHQAGEIWDKEGVAPTLTTMQGGYRQPSIICAVRGRYEEDGSIKQHLEPQKNGATNTITTVQKDNYVLEPNEIKREPPLEREGWHRNAKEVLNAEGISRTISTQCNNLCTKVKDPLNFRIRKLTPLECWRLMGFTDEDFYKAKAALIARFYNGRDRADSKLYKMSGNSIVVTVIEAIGKALFQNKTKADEKQLIELEETEVKIFHW